MDNEIMSPELVIFLRFLIMSAALAVLLVYLIDFYKKQWNKASLLKKWFYLFLPISAVIIILRFLVGLIR